MRYGESYPESKLKWLPFSFSYIRLFGPEFKAQWAFYMSERIKKKSTLYTCTLNTHNINCIPVIALLW